MTGTWKLAIIQAFTALWEMSKWQTFRKQAPELRFVSIVIRIQNGAGKKQLLFYWISPSFLLITHT
jgi:hypothetical protein